MEIKLSVFERIINREAKISIIGLGYVGLPIAVAFAKKTIEVIGFDINKEKIEIYRKGIDPTKEVGNKVLRESTVEFTDDPSKLKESKFHIVAVPTPVNRDHTPDLRLLESATRTVGGNLSKGAIVVFESTVYPGVTEEICIPILEHESGMLCGVDFKVGYSPERINPGDKAHRFEKIVKVVAGMDEETLDDIAKVYELVIDVGVYRAETIKVAEAAKVIENAQRDINIAFMNELSIIFNLLKIDTKSVLNAAQTKWNFLSFNPGLVGGHCIGVDPYYLTYKASQVGYNSKIISSGRMINDEMGHYVVSQLIKIMIKKGVCISNSRVGILGFTFKENCPDVRNTRVIDIINGLNDYGVNTFVVDPVADYEQTLIEFNININEESELKNLDAVIIAVAHDEFSNYKDKLKQFFVKDKANIIFDLKSIYSKNDFQLENQEYWRL